MATYSLILTCRLIKMFLPIRAAQQKQKPIELLWKKVGMQTSRFFLKYSHKRSLIWHKIDFWLNVNIYHLMCKDEICLSCRFYKNYFFKIIVELVILPNIIDMTMNILYTVYNRSMIWQYTFEGNVH